MDVAGPSPERHPGSRIIPLVARLLIPFRSGGRPGHRRHLKTGPVPIRPRICLKEFWYNGPRNGAGCTSFPFTPKKRGHNSQKCGTEPGKQRGLSTGIDEVIFSRIWKAKARAGCGLARWGFWPKAGSMIRDPGRPSPAQKGAGRILVQRTP